MTDRKVLTVQRLVKRFTGAAATSDPAPVLGVAAQMVSLLDSHGLENLWATHLAEADDPVTPFLDVWAGGVEAAPWLAGHVTPLTGWVEHHPHPDQLIRAVAGAFVDLDLKGTVEQEPYGGDLLGPLYLELMSAGSRKAKGAFYTPMNLSMLIAMMSGLEEGRSVCDPCCGSGGMLVAAGKVMRLDGFNPRNVLWVANDIDPVAVALAGVNLTVHAMGPHIWLSVGDGLALDSGTDTDPHVTHRPWWEQHDIALADRAADDLIAAAPPYLDTHPAPLGGIYARALGHRSRRKNTDLAPPGEGGAP